MKQERSIQLGSLWRNVALGSEATYEVTGVDGAHVEATVLEAPGLAAGTRLRLTRAAVLAMERLEGDGGSETGRRG